MIIDQCEPGQFLHNFKPIIILLFFSCMTRGIQSFKTIKDLKMPWPRGASNNFLCHAWRLWNRRVTICSFYICVSFFDPFTSSMMLHSLVGLYGKGTHMACWCMPTHWCHGAYVASALSLNFRMHEKRCIMFIKHLLSSVIPC